MKPILWVQNLLNDAIDDGLTGYIKVNFYKGGIANVNREESFQPPREYKEIHLTKKMAETLKNGGY